MSEIPVASLDAPAFALSVVPLAMSYADAPQTLAGQRPAVRGVPLGFVHGLVHGLVRALTVPVLGQDTRSLARRLLIGGLCVAALGMLDLPLSGAGAAWAQAQPQPPQPQPPRSQPPQTARPGFRDDIAQRVLACTGCHGAEGRAAPDGFYPRIAGKPAGYLLHQLVNFRDGQRSYPPMTHLLQHLTDDYLREIAQYFAGLALPYPPTPAAPASPADALGRQLVQQGDPARQLPACASCHGERLTGVAPAIPGLLGLPRDYLNAQIGAWRIAQRHANAPDCMAQISQRLTPDDVAAVTGWLARQPMPEQTSPATSLPGPMPMACGGVPQ